MNQEVVRIIQMMDQSEIETQMALQCAPVLTGLKVSNLLIVGKENRAAVMKILRETSISFFMLSKEAGRVTFLLYHKERLTELLGQMDVKAMMGKLGYTDFGLYSVLLKFSKKYVQYMKDRGEFPHEMGILLGYPLGDVIGFMENKGQNCLYTGYWKVYCDLADSIRKFNNYNRAKEIVIRMVAQGISIQNIIEGYARNQMSMAM